MKRSQPMENNDHETFIALMEEEENGDYDV